MTMTNKCFRSSVIRLHKPTHITKTEQLTLKNEMKTLEVKMEGYLKRQGYDYDA